MPQTKKGKNPRVSKGAEKPQCDISDKSRIWDDDAEKIRANVCVNDEPLTEFEGKHYCLFHLPTSDKDAVKFEEIFNARLKAVEDRIAETEKLSEAEQVEAKRNIRYDFRFVWFPSVIVGPKDDTHTIVVVKPQGYKFSAVASFKSATFSGSVSFSSTAFSAGVDFGGATFLAAAWFQEAKFPVVANFTGAKFWAHADFGWATFSAEADFESTKFWGMAVFSDTTFGARADFGGATFSGYTTFGGAKFSAAANFSSTKFSKSRPTYFDNVNFEKVTYFDRARFRNEVSFVTTIFGKNSDVFFDRVFFVKNADFQYCTAEGYLRFSNLRQGKESKFDFQEAAFERASRISFHTVRLRPNWFINVDSRKFVLTDIDWEKSIETDYKNTNIIDELKDLEERKIADQKKRLLEIAVRRLAVNAEENNRYEEASKLRYMAMETKRLEELKRFSFSRYLIWLYKWTSGYGESWGWAALILLVVILFFGILYASPLSNFDYGESHRWMFKGEGLVHSLYVAAFQRPEPKAADVLTRFFIILETIFAPLQAALLALAIRRKFMR